MPLYTFTTDAFTTHVLAADDDSAAVSFASAEGIPGVKGVMSLLSAVKDAGGFFAIHEDNDVVGRVDPNTGRITYFPATPSTR